MNKVSYIKSFYTLKKEIKTRDMHGRRYHQKVESQQQRKYLQMENTRTTIGANTILSGRSTNHLNATEVGIHQCFQGNTAYKPITSCFYMKSTQNCELNHLVNICNVSYLYNILQMTSKKVFDSFQCQKKNSF